MLSIGSMIGLWNLTYQRIRHPKCQWSYSSLRSTSINISYSMIGSQSSHTLMAISLPLRMMLSNTLQIRKTAYSFLLNVAFPHTCLRKVTWRTKGNLKQLHCFVIKMGQDHDKARCQSCFVWMGKAHGGKVRTCQWGNVNGEAWEVKGSLGCPGGGKTQDRRMDNKLLLSVSLFNGCYVMKLEKWQLWQLQVERIL